MSRGGNKVTAVARAVITSNTQDNEVFGECREDLSINGEASVVDKSTWESFLERVQKTRIPQKLGTKNINRLFKYYQTVFIPIINFLGKYKYLSDLFALSTIS